MKKLVDLIYGVERAKREFAARHPHEPILAADSSKAIATKGDQPVQRNSHWVAAQRAVILLTSKRIICGKWDIPLETIKTARLIKFKTFLGSGQVLKIEKADGEFCQFGMQASNAWEQQSVLPVIVEKGSLKYSPFSVVVRFIMAGLLIYLLIRKLG